MPNMILLGIKIEKLLRYHCNCHGNLVTTATRYVANAYCPKEASQRKYKARGTFLSSFLDEKSSDENGGIRRRVNTFSSAPFQEEILGVHVKIQKGDARPIL